MDIKSKKELALKALENHSKKYELEGAMPAIPKRLKDFWETEEAFEYDGMCFPEGTILPGWEDDSTFRLHLVAPMWDNMLLGFDDAVVGPSGDWNKACNYLPIFVGGFQSEFCIVVKLDDEKCPVGYFEEGNYLNANIADGIHPLSPSLDDFLEELTHLDEVEVEMDMDEDTIKEAFYSESDYYQSME